MIWIIRNSDTTLPFLDRILNHREIDNIEKFFSPTESDIHSSFLLHDIDKAVNTIHEAVKNNKKIFIHGDFDVDGVTATSIMWLFLTESMNADVLPYIPSRFDEGYGLSEESVEAIIAAGGDLIITVDCGVKDLKIIEKYKDKIDFIITDHHTILKENEYEGEKREVNGFSISKHAKAVVHPALSPEYPFTEICGALVSWKVCDALNKKLGLGYNMMDLVDLAALGTVCDVMPLVDENRVITKLGLEKMRNTKNAGFWALAEVAGVDLKQVDTYHLGFVIGPRINAAGRLEHALDAVRLFCTKNYDAALQLAKKLNKLNSERQRATQNLIELAEEQIEGQKKNKIYFIYADDWPEGIVGLVAGRLSGKYNRPVLVGSKKENIIKGSARSIESFNIADALKKIDKYLVQHGGHAQAAGFQLDYSTLPQFLDALQKLATSEITDEDLVSRIYLDTLLNPSEINLETLEVIERLAPFGNKNEVPLLGVQNAFIADKKLLGTENQHVKFVIKVEDIFFEAIAFNSSSGYSDVVTGDKVDVAGILSKNTWNGNTSLQFKIEDIKRL